MRKNSKMIALSALSAAFAVIFIVIASYVPFLKAFVFLAPIAALLPLSKDFYLGAVLSVIATALLGFLLASFSYQVIVPYIAFLGFHPIVSKLMNKKGLNKILAMAIKAVWCVGALLLTYFITDFVSIDSDIFRKYAVPIIIIGGAILFVVYDYYISYMQRLVERLVARYKL